MEYQHSATCSRVATSTPQQVKDIIVGKLYILRNLKFLTVLAATFAAGLYLHDQPVSADTVIDDFTDARNDRFTNDPSFVFPSEFSLSGVGRATNSGRWATLIGDNAFLTAAHFAPTTGSTIAFYPGNDPTATPFTANVLSGGTRVVSSGGSTDLFVGYLDQVVDSSIDRYAFATTFIAGNAPQDGSVSIDPNNPFQGDLGYIVGISQTNRSEIAIDHSIGLNLVTGYAENVQFQGNTNNDSIIYQYNSSTDPTDLNYITNEAYVSGGDSGAPNFVLDQNGDLLLLGVNSFQLNGQSTEDISEQFLGLGSSQFRGTGITYTGNQVDTINSLIAASPTVATTSTAAVPEPSSATMLMAMFSFVALRRNRNR